MPVPNLDIEISIGKGRGYVPAEEATQRKEQPFWIYSADAIFTPIKKCSLQHRKYPCGAAHGLRKTDHEVITDGTIHPEEGVKQASRILIQHLMIITDENITFDTKEDKKEDLVDEQTLATAQDAENTAGRFRPVSTCFQLFKSGKINSPSELVQYEQEDLMKFRNFGQKSLSEIEQVLRKEGLLSFGMDRSKLKLDDE